MNDIATGKKKRAPRTEPQKAQRVRKREGQKGKLTARQSRSFKQNEEWKPDNVSSTAFFAAGVKEIEFGPDFIVQEYVCRVHACSI